MPSSICCSVSAGELEPHEGLLGWLRKECGARGEADALAHRILQERHHRDRAYLNLDHEPALDSSPGRPRGEVPPQRADHRRVPPP